MSILGLVYKRLMEGTYAGVDPIPEQPPLPTLAFDTLVGTIAASDTVNTNLSVVILRSGVMDATCTVDWAIAGGSFQNSQYAAGQVFNGTLTFNPNEAAKSVPMVLAPQAKTLVNPTIVFALSNATNCNIQGGVSRTVVVDMPDPDETPATPHASITASTATITALTNANSFGTVTVTRTASDLAQNSSANYAVTGMAADKYVTGQIFNGTLNWASGETTKQVSVGVNHRTAGEANQTVTVTFSGLVNLVWDNALSASITIDMPDVVQQPGDVHTFDKRIGWKDQNNVTIDHDPGSLREYNVGVMAITGSSLDYVNTQHGFKCPLQGSKIFQQISNPPQSSDFRGTSWPEICGTGDPVNVAVGVIQTRSQTKLRSRNGVSDMINKDTSVSSGGWIWLGAAPVPMNSPPGLVQDVLDGDFDRHLKRIGENWRFEIDAKAFDYRRVICRLGYEFNQNTAMSFNTGGVGSIFDVPGMTLDKFKRFFAKCITQIWLGYGYRMPMALSPAFESTYNSMTNAIGTDTMSGNASAARRYWIKYGDMIDIDEVAICCGSFHPIDSRVVTKSMAISNCTEGDTVAEELTLKRYSPAVIMRVARATGRQVAFLEHSVGRDNAAFYDQSLKYACWAYKTFGEMCHNNKDIMFGTGVLGTHMTNYTAAPGGHSDNTAAWRNLVEAYLWKFGKVGKYADPTGDWPN